MSEFSGQTDQLNGRIRRLGHSIFELSDGARSRIWQRSWWLDAMIDMLDMDPKLKTRAFEFVDCLPSLKTNEQLIDHISQYFDPDRYALPLPVALLVRPGVMRQAATGLICGGVRFGASMMASRFITGYNLSSVMRTLSRLRRARMGFTLDVLGEFTTSNAQADRYAGAYLELLDHVAPIVGDWRRDTQVDGTRLGDQPRANFSVKLSSLDAHFDAIDLDGSIERVGGRLRPILRKARTNGAFINVDLESYKYHDIAYALFKQILMEDEFRGMSDVGIVVQAYLRDSRKDLESLLDWGRKRGTRFAIRLVKGAYWDAETAAAVRAYKEPPVWTQKWQSDANYERLSRIMLAHADLIRPCFASHNVRSLASVIGLAEQAGLTSGDYEVQMLYGMGDPLKSAMRDMGQCVRVYCPYGDLMPGMGYLIRRLLENTSNDGFLKQGFGERRRYDFLLQDPAKVRPPSAPLPRRFYQNTDPEEQPMMFRNASNTNFALEENREKMRGALAYVRGEFGRSHGPVINHEPVGCDLWEETINPSNTSEVVGRVALASIAEADTAVAAASAAFESWRITTASERADVLRRAADRMEARRFELAATMVLEVGKPWREADADVTEAVDHCRFYAEQIERMESRPRIRNLPGEDNRLVYSPKGVCVVISPWSFPLAILTGMTTAALAAGNTVVIKPAPQAAVLASKFMELLIEAGAPAGVVNFLPGRGNVVGRHLVTHGDVNVVAFTGSYEVGREIIESGHHQRPGQPFIKKLIVEMGGKNAIIVDDDCDLDGAIEGVMESAFSYAGQKCSSCSRVIVMEGIYDQFARRLREAASSLIIGPAEDPATIVGPVIDAPSRDRVMHLVQTARQESRVVIEVPMPKGLQGCYVSPIVFDDVSHASSLAQEEVFGPVLAMMKASSFEEALALANDSRYALTGGLYSRNPERIELAQRDFAVGNLYINRRITGSQVDAQPFGGFKLSGTGVKAGSPDYLMHFMDARCITENTQRSGLVPGEASADEKHQPNEPL